MRKKERESLCERDRKKERERERKGKERERDGENEGKKHEIQNRSSFLAITLRPSPILSTESPWVNKTS